MKDASSAKSWRLLDIYSRLVNGEQLKKSELALQYQVSEKSIQRDMSSLRDFMEERDLSQELIYDTKQSAYHLIARRKHGLCEGEMLAVGKILLDSRSLRRDEMLPMLERLINCCIPNAKRKPIKDLLLNEEYHYIEPQHGKHLFNLLWSLGQAIQAHQVLRIQYMKQDASCVKREIEPVGLMFSEFYFYLVGFIQNINKEQSFQNPADTFPTIYRVDRINELFQFIFLPDPCQERDSIDNRYRIFLYRLCDGYISHTVFYIPVQGLDINRVHHRVHLSLFKQTVYLTGNSL